MTVQEVAYAFTSLCQEGKLHEASITFLANDVVSIEPYPGDYSRLQGKDAVLGKQEMWSTGNTIHSVSVMGPFLNGDQFALRFSLDCTSAQMGRATLEEVALYTVANGKIVEEKFLGMF